MGKFSETTNRPEIFDELVDKSISYSMLVATHYNVIKWKHFLRYWPFVQGVFVLQATYS